MRKRADGFTLVELMVVVLVIGILVAVAVPVFNAAKTRAETNTCKANQRIIMGAVEAKNASDDPIVLSVGDAVSDGSIVWVGSGAAATGGTAKVTAVGMRELAPDYLKSMPVCPARPDSDASTIYPQNGYFWVVSPKIPLPGYGVTGPVNTTITGFAGDGDWTFRLPDGSGGFYYTTAHKLF